MGAITFFAFLTLIGFPSSLHPVSLLTSAILSALLGLPAGYLVSRERGGMVHGALITGSLFALLLDLSRRRWKGLFASCGFRHNSILSRYPP